MNVKVVRIGNSRGIRIPKKILDQCQIEDAVDLVVTKDRIVLKPIRRRPREGWEDAAKTMNDQGDDELLIPDVFQDDIEPEE